MDYSIIIPVYNEQKALPVLINRLYEINQKIEMKELKLRFKKNFKTLFGINWVDKK